MMPELGKYAFEVTLAYGVSLGLLGLLIGLSVRASRRARRALSKIEGDHDT